MMEAQGNPKVDWFFEKDGPWREEYRALRRIALGCGLTEELKWGKPCYTAGGRNVVLIHGFNEYCALLFMSGALMKDEHHLLIRQTQNVQAARQARFTGVGQIEELAGVLAEYILEAAKIEEAGLQMPPLETEDFPVPQELQSAFDESPDFEAAFHALTPGRQRAYLLHFSAPKQEKTRIARVEKWRDAILLGKGLND